VVKEDSTEENESQIKVVNVGLPVAHSVTLITGVRDIIGTYLSLQWTS